VLRLETELTKIKGPVGIGKAVAWKDGKVCAEAELTFMISD
jgi:3-hydroxyacyl-[acyl-carrier-protein] dehydratase